MKKFLPWIIVAVVVFGIYSWAKGFNNTAVNLKEDATKTWANV